MFKKVKSLTQELSKTYWQLAYKIPGIKKLTGKQQILLIGTIIPLAGSLSLFFYLFWGLPLPTQITSQSRNPVSTQILDRNGKLVYEIFESKRRTPITLEGLPPYLKEATVAIEDKNFYHHWGLSISGMTRAIFKTTVKQDLQGGSTITQQLVKTTLLTPERTLRRKLREVVLTLIVEALYSKDKILEMYLNNIPYGGTAWGIEAAAQAYFGKGTKDLSLAEASLLAGLPAAPTRYSPFGAHPELAKERQVLVLRRMVEEGYISEGEGIDAKNETLKFTKQEGLKAPHFALFVKDQLVDQYGQDLVERGGLRVKTTLDLELQEFAQNAVATEITKLKRAHVGNGAALVTIPKTGEILAMVGSKDYFAEDEDGKVNVTIRPRQPGSAIKPLNYALGIQNGYITLATPLADIPTCFNVAGQPPYCPVNYDGSFHGAVQVRFTLGNSYNIPAVRVLALNGLSEFISFAQKMGISTFGDPSQYGLSLTLGGGEVKMIDMVTAFGVFANQGIKQEHITILEVGDWKGNLLQKTEIKEGDRVLPNAVAYLISHILLDNNARSQAFGPNSLLNVVGHPEVSVKTGTTNDRRDNWTIGYSPEVVVATWVGNNDNTPMSAVASGVTGASPIWNKIVKEALNRIEGGEIANFGAEAKEHEHSWVTKPDEIIGANVCATTGQLANQSELNPETQASTPEAPQADCPARFEYFLQEFPPKPFGSARLPVQVFKDTGVLAPPEAPLEQIETREQQVYIDPLGTLVCLDCPPQDWQVSIRASYIPQRD